MDQKESSGDLRQFLRDRGECLARFFYLLLPDPLDAEDLFLSLFARDRGGPAALPAAAATLIRAHRRRRGRSAYHPIEVADESPDRREPSSRTREAWHRVPFSGRASIVLRLGDFAEKDEMTAALGIAPEELWGRAERGLLALQKEIDGRGRSAVSPRGWASGEMLARVLADEKFAGTGPGRGGKRFHGDLVSAIESFRLLEGRVLRKPDWRRLEKRALREMPPPGATLLFDAFDTPFGPFEVAAIDRTVVGTCFGRRGERGWAAVFGGAAERVVRDPEALRRPRRELLEYFEGRRKRFTFSYRLVETTTFQASVLDAVARVPYGSVRTYKQIAEAAGRPEAHRAAGGALGRNPIPVVIPCHRVIAQTGHLGGFSAGPSLKERLLSLEGLGDLFAPLPPAAGESP
ncbi:MAG: methylated-DNA--[protein]-cysteine S-methyltransferase [Candidatus Eisenbacteria bacterium]